MARGRTKKKIEDAKMDMTPIIDVVFNLLIFFMLTMDFKEEEGSLLANLPKDEGISPQINPIIYDPIRIRIQKLNATANTKVFIGSALIPDPLQDPGPLRIRLSGLMNTNSETPVIIDPSEQANYKHIISVLNTCKEVGVQEIKFSAKPMKK